MIKVYSTPNCVYCNKLKTFLDENNIAYENVDITTDPALREEMVKLSGQMSVPVTVIEGEKGTDVVVGSDEEIIKEILGL